MSDSEAIRIGSNAVRISWLVPQLAPPIMIAAVFSVVLDFGDKTNLAVYEAFAQILPVLALAAFVELLPALRALIPAVDIGDKPDEEKEVAKAIVQIWVYALVGYLVIGESAALWALGTDNSSTFLLLVSSFCGLLMVRSLTEAHLERYEPALDERFAAAAKRVEEAEQ